MMEPLRTRDTEPLVAPCAGPAAGVDFLFIGELAKETGADPKTIRFYERAGLLSPPRHGRFRTYLASDVQRLKDVLFLRRMGLPIAKIRLILNRTVNGQPVLEAPGTGHLLQSHLASLHEKQAEVAQQIETARIILEQTAACPPAGPTGLVPAL